LIQFIQLGSSYFSQGETLNFYESTSVLTSYEINFSHFLEKILKLNFWRRKRNVKKNRDFLPDLISIFELNILLTLETLILKTRKITQ